MQREQHLGQVRRAANRCGLVCLLAAAHLVASWCVSEPRCAAAQAGLGEDALPGVITVPSAAESALVAGTLSAGYGFTSEVLGLGDSHHRANVDGAASGAPLPQLLVGGSLGARIDTHQGEDSGGTSGVATHASLAVRGRFEVREQLHLGFEALALLPPSKTAKRSLQGLTPEFNGMATYQNDRYLVTGAIGARINRSYRGFPGSSPLTPYEALALGESNDTQILVGIGGGIAAGPVWCLVDFQYEPYVGSTAPAVGYSPALLGLGVRGELRAWLQLGLNVRTSLAPYPPAGDVGNTPVPPRVSAQGYVTLRWDTPPAPQPTEPAPGPSGGPVADEPPEPTLGSLSGEVTGLHGHPIPDAAVHVHVQRESERHSVTLEGGSPEFEFVELERGDWKLRVEADGYEPSSRTVRVPSDRPLRIRLDRALPPGHIEVRVQDFRGRQVEANVVLLPDRTPFQPTSETGLYNLDLAPGEYELEIVAEGYAPETRTAVVAQNGVTIVVVDLRRAQEAQ